MAFQPRIAESGRPCCAQWNNGYGTGDPLPSTNPCPKCVAYFAKQNLNLLQENSMAFKPRLKTDGTPCCFRRTDDGGMAFPRTPPCAPCTEYFNEIGRRQEQRAAELRTLDEFDPPDPYSAALERRRREEAARTGRTYVPPPTDLPFDPDVIPDPYAEGLDKMRRERR